MAPELQLEATQRAEVVQICTVYAMCTLKLKNPKIFPFAAIGH